MALIDGMLQELEQEAQTTRRVLERVPDAHLGWKPHEKSMSLGQLAMHIAMVPGGVAEIGGAAGDAASGVRAAVATQASELLPALEDSLQAGREALGGMDDRRSRRRGRCWMAIRKSWRCRGSPSAIDHAEPLVPPSWSVVGLSASAECAGAVDLRAQRRREPLRATGRRSGAIVRRRATSGGPTATPVAQRHSGGATT